MSLTTIALIGILLFLILMFLGMHIGLSMALAGFIGLLLVRGVSPAMYMSGITAYSNSTNYYLTVIPLFTWMGVLAAHGGLSKNAFATLNKWVGHLPGGLAMATTGACAAFGAVCGSNTATALTMVTAALPEMRRYKYNDELSLGSIAAGGNLGFLIPPSGAFIVYGFVTQVSIGKLFIAGILPGILLTLLFWITIYIVCKINPSLSSRGAKFGWGERLKSLKELWGVVLLFCIVMGGIYAGVFTPTEAAAIGVLATLLLGLLNRQITRRNFFNSLEETMTTTAMIFLLIIGAMIFGSFLTSSEITLTLGRFIASWNVNAYVVLAAFLVFYIIGGFFMDVFALLIVSLPIAFPIVVETMGFDPVVFGVLSVLTIMMGSISPPVGITVFAVHGIVRDVPMYTIFRGCVPFIVAMLACLIILVAFPQISLLLPSFSATYQ